MNHPLIQILHGIQLKSNWDDICDVLAPKEFACSEVACYNCPLMNRENDEYVYILKLGEWNNES